MRRVFVISLAAAAVSMACGGDPAPTAPAPASATLTPVSGPGDRVTFSGLSANDAPVSSYSEAGYTLTASGASWVAKTTYGKPAPFMQFTVDAGQTVEGAINITAGGAAFTFASVDLYASIIPIPYQITGLRNSAVVFTVADTIPNTFGAFRTVTNDNAGAIDTLRIVLRNAGPACCRNPMGLDNLIFGQ